MLENMRKSGASVFVWVIFAILIAVFVINFGPQGNGSSQGCGGGSSRTALVVGDSEVDDSAMRLTVNITGATRQIPDEILTEFALDTLIKRELLAQEAERRGLRVPEGLLDRVISQGEMHVGGEVIPVGRQIYFKDGVFDYKVFKRFLQGWGMSVNTYKRLMEREVLASTMARIVEGSVPVSREEALAQYIASRTMVTFDAVRFDPRRYADALLLTDADIDRWVAAHEAEVKATFSEALYKGKKQIHVRRIKLDKLDDGETPPGAAPGAPVVDPATAKLEALRAEIVAGKKTFVDAARASDLDDVVRARGGDWGWYDEGATTLPEPVLNDAVKALEKGKVSEVVEGSDGFYLLTVDDRREGDLTFDQVKRELGEKLARAAWGKEAAKRAALATLEQARAGAGKNLRDLYPTEKTGAIVVESEDVPVAWTQDEPAAPATGSGAAPAPATGAAPAPATGAAPAPATAPAAGDAVKASDEVLPKLGTIDPPTVETFGPFSRGGRTPIGESAELSRALFDELTAGMIAPKVFEVRETKTAPSPKYVVVQLANKQMADVAEFEKMADTYVSEIGRRRGRELLQSWLAERCTALASKGKIKPATELLRRRDDKGNLVVVPYQPCFTMALPES